MDLNSINFVVVSTGKRVSNIDERKSFKVLANNNRMKVSDNLKRSINVNEHLSYGVQPQINDGKVILGLFASVPSVDSDGETIYPSSSKIAKTGEFTDANISTNLRGLVTSQLIEGLEGEEKDDKLAEIAESHMTFLPAKDDDDNEIFITGVVNDVEVKVQIMEFVELEEKQR